MACNAETSTKHPFLGKPKHRLLAPTEADPPTMSAGWNLHCLYSLGPSSPDFLRRLYSLIRYDEEERYLSRLQGSELIRLLDFLDRVSTLLLSFLLAAKQPLQTLDAIPSDDDVSKQCLHKLQAICSHHAALPSSCFASGGIDRVGDNPVVLGDISDVWEGIYRNKRVSVEHLKVPLNDNQACKKVRAQYGNPLVRIYLTRKGRRRSSNRQSCGKGSGTLISSLSSGSQQIRCKSSQGGCRTEL